MTRLGLDLFSAMTSQLTQAIRSLSPEPYETLSPPNSKRVTKEYKTYVSCTEILDIMWFILGEFSNRVLGHQVSERDPLDPTPLNP